MKKTPVQIFVLLFWCSLFISGLPADARAGSKTLLLTRNELVQAKATSLSLNFEIGAATIIIEKISDNETAVRAVATYEDGQPEPALSTNSDNGTYSATFSSGYDVQFTALPQAQEWKIALGNYAVKTDLTLMCGGVTGSAELGGLPLRSCTFLLGVAELTINFSTPTTRPVELMLAAGTGFKLALGSIGNTDFEVFGALGIRNIIDLDFSGSLGEGSHTVTMIEMGDSTKVTVPADSAARVKSLSLKAGVAVTGGGWQTNYSFPLHQLYSTVDYASRDTKINFDITAFASKIIIERK